MKAAIPGGSVLTAGVSKSALTHACHLAMFVFGIDLAVLGALLPSLFQRIDLDPSQAGSLFIFLNGGGLIVALASGPVFDTIGYRILLTVSAAMSAGCLVGIAYADSYSTLVLCSFLLGLGGGGLNSGSNAFIADLHPENQAAALNRLGAFFGVGAVFIPLFIGSLLNFVPLSTILVMTAVIAASPGILYLVLRFPPGKHATGGFPLREARRLLLHPVVLLIGILLFFQSGNEMTVNAWLATHLVNNLPLSAAQGPLYLAGFWGAVMVGRAVSPRILRYMSERTLIQASALASAVAVLLFALYPHILLSALLAVLIGFCMAAIFPCVLGIAASSFPGFSATVFGIVMSMALVGGMVIPWVSGELVEARGTKVGLLVAASGFVMVFVLQTILTRRRGVTLEFRGHKI